MTAVLHRNLKVTPPLVVRSSGAYLIDSEGRKYIDACGGAAVSCLGHNNRRIVDAISKQLDKVAYAHTSFFTNEPAEQLARALVDRAPIGFGNGRVMFLGSGSEAMEAALKLARQYHLERGAVKRSRVIAREMAYHGNTLGALAVGGHPQRRAPYEPLLIEVGRVPACYGYRNKKEGEIEEAFGERMANALADEILRLGPETVAAFVCEPVSGATLGCVPPATGYFERVREICTRYGVLLIADEVMCGMGRTGTTFALEQEETAPDIITIAKGLGAGYQPIAGVMASEQVVSTLVAGSSTLWNGHTYMSHAVACAGALAVLQVVEEEQLLNNVRTQGDRLGQLLLDRFGDHPHVGDVRGRGLFWAIELVEDRLTKEPFPPALNLASRIKSTAHDNGMLCYPSAGCVDGKRGDHVLLAPSYDVTQEQLHDVIDILDETIEACLST
ncbi:MAG: aspartate aminotransferase family protein [Gemmatimonadaceae bacterium]|nr:aspartate aminotransferase family protein [Gemmatimonadaceae bacterium]